MKKLLIVLSLLVAQSAVAVKALRGWQTGRLTDGTPVLVQACGDEWGHYFVDAENRPLQMAPDGTLYYLTDTARLRQNRARKAQARQQRHAARQSAATGRQRGLIILVSFANKDFSYDNAQDVWSRIANEPGYHEGRAYGSVRDYFLEQSYGQFDLTFDVVGPVQMPNDYAYYGRNDKYGDDANVGELVRDACLAVQEQINFADYDWDGDGEVEQVYILYAGYGENEFSLRPDLIWPHEWALSGWDGYEPLSVGGVLVDTYACSNEMSAGGQLAGMGTICHEFSHCLGLPDFYDTETGSSVLGDWDVMDSGNYNNNSWRPAGYSAYERAYCGWLALTTLTEPCQVAGQKALSAGGEAYQIVNDCDNPAVDEYYVLENRQQEGWDAYLPGSGLLVTHVDYDEDAWYENTPNAERRHRRLSYISPRSSLSGNICYPYVTASQQRDSLTDSSTPAATVFNRNRQGTTYMGKPVTAIRADEGLVSFTFMGGPSTALWSPSVPGMAPAGHAYDLGGRQASPSVRGLTVRQGKKYFK